MTRFARAKGSKASNERREEEPTPWHVMRQQLEDQLSGESSQKNINVDLKSILNNDSGNSTKEDIWSDFGESKRKNVSDSSKVLKKSKKHNTEHFQEKETKYKSKKITEHEITEELNQTQEKRKKSKTNPTEVNVESYDEEDKHAKLNPIHITKQNKKERPTESVCNVENKKCKTTTEKTVFKNKKKSAISLKPDTTKESNNKSHRSINQTVKKTNMNKITGVRNNNKNKKMTENGGNFENKKCKTNDKSNSTILRNTISIPLNETENITNDNTVTNINKTVHELKPIKASIATQYEKNIKTKNNNKSFLTWKNYNNGHTIIANGREIKVVEYEGFLVKKDDAVELKKLKRKLRAQSISNDQIKNIMKLERRKAEKALAREKTNVCFHCRKFGHKFSDCPDIKDTELSKSGMCFKCGSMEHSHFQCKVLQGQDFRYAVCFVCKDQGHIARQCSLNPQGQYPKGGSCHLCGEVTHLRKDCPKATEQPSKSLTLMQIENEKLEDITDVPAPSKIQDKRKQIVRF